MAKKPKILSIFSVRATNGNLFYPCFFNIFDILRIGTPNSSFGKKTTRENLSHKNRNEAYFFLLCKIPTTYSCIALRSGCVDKFEIFHIFHRLFNNSTVEKPRFIEDLCELPEVIHRHSVDCVEKFPHSYLSRLLFFCHKKQHFRFFTTQKRTKFLSLSPKDSTEISASNKTIHFRLSEINKQIETEISCHARE